MIINTCIIRVFCSKNEREHFFFENTGCKKSNREGNFPIHNFDITHHNTSTNIESTVLTKKEIEYAEFNISGKGDTQINFFFNKQTYDSITNDYFQDTKFIDAEFIVNKFITIPIRLNKPIKKIIYIYNRHTNEVDMIYNYSVNVQFYYQKHDVVTLINKKTKEKKHNYLGKISIICQSCLTKDQRLPIPDKLIEKLDNTSVIDHLDINEEQGVIQRVINKNTYVKEVVEKQIQPKEDQCTCGDFLRFNDSYNENIFYFVQSFIKRKEFPAHFITFVDKEGNCYYFALDSDKALDEKLKDEFIFYVKDIYSMKDNSVAKVENNLFVIKKISFLYIFDNKNQLLHRSNIKMGYNDSKSEYKNFIGLKINTNNYPVNVTNHMNDVFFHQKHKIYSNCPHINSHSIASKNLTKSLLIGASALSFIYTANEVINDHTKTDQDLVDDATTAQKL